MFTLIMEFERDKEDGVEALNAVLAAMPLSDLSLEDADGYMKTTRNYKDGCEVSVRLEYGLDKVVLTCERDEDEPLRIWRLDVETVPAGDEDEENENEGYADRWRAAHPDRMMRLFQQIRYQSGDAFLVLHHERA